MEPAMHADDQRHGYAEHLVAEHRRLHRLLAQARTAIAEFNGPDREPAAADVARVLRNVRDELQHHFAQEEADGCLEKASAGSPELAAEARRIRDEHPRLLETADALIAQALDSDQSVQKRVALELAFDALRHHLESHEVAENFLLRKYISAD
jgi:hypothetical protein